MYVVTKYEKQKWGIVFCYHFLLTVDDKNLQ